jgi:two-component system NtrC family sensor kinase
MVPPEEGDLSAEKLLAERPSLSIRSRIIVAFVVAFLFSLGIAATSMVFILRLDNRQMFLGQARNITYEVQEARRYEKNFFLYGSKSDLYEAQNNINAASNILQGTANEMGSVLRKRDFEALTKNLNAYRDILRELASKSPESGLEQAQRDPELEDRLRLCGHQVLLLATDLEAKERDKMRTTAHTFTLVAIFSLVLDLIIMIWLARELIQQILQPLSRAVEYTQRIAAGDFSMITPKRSYRDEFSDLAIAINRMICELREKQEQLVQSRKMAAIGTLTSGIAHELNNPLNNIGITSEALLQGLDDYSDEQKRKMLEDIFIEVERANGTVRNLLDFTRVERPMLDSIDVKELVTSSLHLVNNELTINHVEVESDFQENLPPIRANLRNLQQVFLNLFLNGIQAMPGGGKLRIRGREDDTGAWVVVDVADTGCGIAPENLPKIFDPFFTTKEEGKGTGLGLSVSYGIIQKMGGKITVESEVGKGTAFHIHLAKFFEPG